MTKSKYTITSITWNIGYFSLLIITFLSNYTPELFAADGLHSPELTKVTLELDGFAQFRFAGYYMALEKHYYEEAGLNVTIVPGSNQNIISSSSNKKAANFRLGDSSLLVKYNQGASIVALGALFQSSSLVAISSFDKKISTPKNFASKKILANNEMSRWTINALAQKEDVPLDSFQILSGLHPLRELIDNNVDVIMGREDTLPYILSLSGSRYQIINPADYGIRFYDDIIYTERRYVEENPEAVRRFLEATWKGWSYAFANTDETINTLLTKYSQRKSKEYLRHEASIMRKFVLPDLIELGTMSRFKWEKIGNTFVAIGVLSEDFDLNNFLYNPADYIKADLSGIIIWFVIAASILISVLSILIAFNTRLKKSINENSANLINNQQRLKIALDNAHEGLWDWNIENDTFFYTPSCWSILGYAPNEISYSLDMWKSLIHPEDSAKVDTAINAILTTPHIKDIPIIYARFLSKSKEYIFIAITVYVQEVNNAGTAKRLIVTQKDITREKEIEELLKNRLQQLTRPITAGKTLEFSEIFDIDKIQQLQDSFAKLTNIASIIVSIDGKAQTKASNFSAFCRKIRATSFGANRCCESDSVLSTRRGTYNVRECSSGGLIDGCASIWVDDKRIANWMIGQVRFSESLTEKQLAYAKELGLDLDEFKEDFLKIPLTTPENFNNICNTMAIIADQLSELAYQNTMQARVIFEKQQAEERLLNSEKKLIEAQRISKIGNWRYNTETNMFCGSQQFWETIHLDITPDEEVDIDTSFSSFYLEDAEETKTNIKNLLDMAEEDNLLGEDIAFRLADSPEQQRYTHVLVQVVSKTANGYKIIEGTSQDITQRAQNEIALKESRENLRIIFESIVNGLIVTDAYGIITETNPMSLEILNKSKEELIQTNVADAILLFEPETMLSVRNPVTKVLETKEKVIYNEHCVYISKNDICKYIMVNASPIKNPDNSLIGAVLIIHDITEQYELEQNLHQAQKLEAIGKLAGGIAHDFNNLLGGIMGFADLICMKTDNEEINTYAKHILDTTERAAELTSQMLTFARKGNSSTKPINVHDCIDRALSILKHSIGTNIVITTELNAEKATIIGDFTQLQNGIINLGINARDAIDGNGEFIIKTENNTLSQEFCNNSEFNIKPGEYITIYVSDSGKGIPYNIQSKIFEPFFTTKGVGKGTGLGLPAFLGTVISHNGSINIKSKEEKGTCFTINLPLTSLSIDEFSNSALPLVGKKNVVLLVDDQQMARSFCKTILEDNGCKVLIADNGEQALKVYLEKGHTIDLVIMDLVMPVMDGEEAAEHLLQIDPKVNIILSSGLSKPERIDNLILDGTIKGFLPKPYSNSKLKNLLKDIL